MMNPMSRSIIEEITMVGVKIIIIGELTPSWHMAMVCSAPHVTDNTCTLQRSILYMYTHDMMYSVRIYTQCTLGL